jgi:hypothetical protein
VVSTDLPEIENLFKENEMLAEITGWDIYWITRLDLVKVASLSIMVISIVVTILILIGCAMHADFDQFSHSDACVVRKGWRKKFIGFIRFAIPTAFLCCMVFVFTPTSKELCAIYVVPPIINNEQVQELPSRILDLGVEWLEELKPDKAE